MFSLAVATPHGYVSTCYLYLVRCSHQTFGMHNHNMIEEGRRVITRLVARRGPGEGGRVQGDVSSLHKFQSNYT